MPAKQLTARIKTVRADEWLAGLVFVLAVVASTWTWLDLARSAHFPPAIAAVPSLSLDLGGLYYARNWISGRTAALRTWGKVTTILAFGVSISGNAVQHAIEAGFLAINIWIVLAVGAVPVLALFGIAHQWGLAGAATSSAPSRTKPAKPSLPQPAVRQGSQAAAAPDPVGEADPAPSPTVAQVVQLSKQPRRGQTRRGPVRRDLVRAYMRAHPEEKPAEVVRGLEAEGVYIKVNEACKVRDSLRAERAAEDQAEDREEVRA